MPYCIPNCLLSVTNLIRNTVSINKSQNKHGRILANSLMP